MKVHGGGGDQTGDIEATTDTDTTAPDAPSRSDGGQGGRSGHRPDGPARGRSHSFSDLHRLAGEGALSVGGSIASSVLGFAITVVITRGIPTRSAGVLFEAIALFMILSNTAELGADTGLVRMISMYRVQDR